MHDDRHDRWHRHRRWHEEHHRRWHQPLGPIGRYVRERLHRRIFVWFAGGIVFTTLLVTMVLMAIVRVQDPAWSRSWDGVQTWVARQFARDWDDPAKRDEFARQSARDLQLNLVLEGADGQELLAVGERCKSHFIDAPIVRNGQTVGRVRGCVDHPSHAWRWPAALFAVIAGLWFVSGKVARRLARPLDELAETVRKIGRGDISARTKLSCREPDEIGVVADAVNDMATRIEKQMADQRELLATVSHELRTPLARVRIISEIARDTGATPKTYDELDREVQEMDGLVGQLLAQSQVEFGVVSKRALSVKDVAQRALERAGATGATLELEGTHDELSADPTLLQRALSNLFDNAAKHAGGASKLRVVSSEKSVRFEVIDEGPGLPMGEKELFEKFRRGEGPKAEGLGLGLALVKRIVDAHGGTVFARNGESKGAIIGFEIART